jgi:hypothetical protein
MLRQSEYTNAPRTLKQLVMSFLAPTPTQFDEKQRRHHVSPN